MTGCYREKLVGFVVGVKGSKVFCLQMDSMKTVDVRYDATATPSSALPFTTVTITALVVGRINTSFGANASHCLPQVPQSASMHKFLQKGDIIGAHAIALLGVTESDWRLLGESPNTHVLSRAGTKDPQATQPSGSWSSTWPGKRERPPPESCRRLLLS